MTDIKNARLIKFLFYILVLTVVYYAIGILGILFDERNHAFVFLTLSVFLVMPKSAVDIVTERLHGVKNFIRYLLPSVFLSLILFGYPLFLKATGYEYSFLHRLVIFAITIAWSMLAVAKAERIFFACGDRFVHIKSTGDNKIIEMRSFLLFFLLVFIPLMMISIVFYPGVISYDSNRLYVAASGLGDPANRSDIHSFAYLVLLRLAQTITTNPYLLVFIQIVLFSVIWSVFFSFLCSRGLHIVVGVFASILIDLIPANSYILCAIWKDIPFCLCLFFVTFLLVIPAYSEAFIDTYWWNALLGLSIFGMTSFRSNGLVSGIIVLIVLLIIGLRHKWKKIVITALSVAMLIGFYKGPIFELLQVSDNSSLGDESFASAPFIDGIWENIYVGNQLSEEVEAYMYSIMPREEWIESYRENYCNILYVNKQEGWANVSMQKSVEGYMWCLINHPRTTLKERLRKTSTIWCGFPANPSIPNSDQPVYIDMTENAFGWDFIGVLRGARELFARWYNDDHLVGAFTSFVWRGGTNLVALIFGFGILAKKRRGLLVLPYVPIFGSIISLLMACCYADYRYNWPTLVVQIPLTCSCLLLSCNKSIREDITGE